MILEITRRWGGRGWVGCSILFPDFADPRSVINRYDFISLLEISMSKRRSEMLFRALYKHSINSLVRALNRLQCS